MPKNITDLAKILDISFNNIDILKQAVVHRSFLNENRNFDLEHNERLEFLGDAVLELVVTEYLYLKYKNPEGELTNWRASLVNSQMLAAISSKLKVNDFLYLSKGEAKDEATKARQSILANALEAIIGAIYLDKGWDESKKFIEKHVITELPLILQHKLYLDPKSRFQEVSQEKTGNTPEYRVMKEAGPDHAKHFVVGVFLGEELIAEGSGTSKQEAQVNAARKALEVKNWLEESPEDSK